MAAVRKIALNIIKIYKTQTGQKRSIKGFRRVFGWNKGTMTGISDSCVNKTVHAMAHIGQDSGLFASYFYDKTRYRTLQEVKSIAYVTREQMLSLERQL